jgi:UDP-N-acetylmuramoylalanine--D-glutamate ligase
MDLKDRKILVVGLARTGVSVAKFLKNQGAHVTVTDVQAEDVLHHYVNDLKDTGIKMELGGHVAATFASVDLVVVSPGVPHNIAMLEAAREKGVPVVGEIELAGRFIKEPILAVTGTNGKTTTTTLLGEMLSRSGFKVYVGGNIGTPLIEYAASDMTADAVVAEISSFQLDTIDTFRPHVGVLLNITEDHLDRYANFKEYILSKGRLFENQTTADVAVLNAKDVATKSMAEDIKGRKLFFNLQDSTASGSVVRDTEMICSLPHKEPVLFDISGFRLKGRHNLENASAAALAALAAGGTCEGIQDALNRFKGLPHRLTYVRTVDGVDYYDDSKGTNVDSVVRSLESFDEPIFLIIGGRDKGGSYSKLEPLVKTRVKKILAIGEAQKKIIAALGASADIIPVNSMEEAVKIAHGEAISGDVVLLSPACSSFDMFRDYTERGEVFCRAVEEIEERSEDRGQKSEDRSQRTEIRGQRTEDRGQRTEIRE